MITNTPIRTLCLAILILLPTALAPIAPCAAAPVADAGADQTVLDREGDGAEDVILDATGSTDSSGEITGYLWEEGSTQIATESLVRTNLSVGAHTLTLTVTNDSAATDTDTVAITVTALTGPMQRLNLKNTTTRFTRPDDLVWPANPGEADICLWADDMFAAASITIDDNTAPDHQWWIDRGNQYGWKFTWFIIINSLYENSGNSYFGSWPEFNTLFGLGHAVQSHSMNHHSDDDVRPEAEVIVEYRDSLAQIEQNMPGNTAVFFAWPCGNSNRDVAAVYAAAGRGVTGGPNAVEKIDYLDTHSGSGNLGADYVDSVLYGTSGISWMGNNKYLRGWMCSHFHLIQDRTALEADMAYLAAHDDQIWVGLFGDVARYGQERDTATLTVTTNNASQIAFTLSDEMDDTIFDYPLTVKVKLYSSWTAVSATQDGSPIEATLVTHDNETYALVKAVPDKGTVVLTPGGAGNVAPVADAGTDQTLTDTDDSGAEDVMLDGTGSSDSDGSIVGYVWEESAAQIASGSSPTVSFAVGTHAVTLTVTDDDGAADSDSVTITVNAAPTGSTTYTLTGDVDDREIRSDGSMVWIGQASHRVGGSTGVADSASIFVFQLPSLDVGEAITGANLEFNLISISNTPPGNVDLYGLGYRSSPTVLTTDFFQGAYDTDATDAWAVQDDILVLSTPAGTVTTDAGADDALAAYLAAQYAAGAQGGDYVFLRLNPDIADVTSYYYWTVTSGNSTPTPVLTIETGGQAANIAPTADAGADQTVTDVDDSGDENITLDGSGSADSDGTIVSYFWTVSSYQIATGVSPTVVFAVGAHSIDLTITDDDGAVDTDSVVITVTAAAQTLDIEGDTADRELREDGSMRWIGQADVRVGGVFTALDGVGVFPFQLPTLQAGETIVAAGASFYLQSIANTPSGAIDLYGLPWRSNPTVLTTDYFEGAYDTDANATAIQDDILTPTTPTGAFVTTSAANANLAAYLNAQYAAGAQGGDYVFLRLTPDVTDFADYRYWSVSTANNATIGQRPMISLQIGNED